MTVFYRSPSSASCNPSDTNARVFRDISVKKTPRLPTGRFIHEVMPLSKRHRVGFRLHRATETTLLYSLNAADADEDLVRIIREVRYG
ncbi:MAG: hypothetical protein JXA28_03690 [Bacteroidetes bacterium]|nr:hypothetical protein [Bacteroidota bacterium]